MKTKQLGICFTTKIIILGTVHILSFGIFGFLTKQNTNNFLDFFNQNLSFIHTQNLLFNKDLKDKEEKMVWHICDQCE